MNKTSETKSAATDKSTKSKKAEKQTETREQFHIISRILEIDKAIRNDEYPNSKRYEKDWGISRSTFSRYIDLLRLSYDAPVEFDFRRNGYYYSDKTFFIQNVMLKEGELVTISMILPLLEQYKNTPLEKSFREIITKITDMLPDNISVDSSFINNEVHFISDPITHLEDGVFDSVLKATKLHRALELDYKTSEDERYTTREFYPYHMICQKGSWYVIGYSFHSNDIRVYAMPRIKNLRILEKQFSIPKDFKLEKYIDPDFGIWKSTSAPVKIELLFDKNFRSYILERDWHKTQVIKENDDGTVYLSFETNQIAQTINWILQFAGNVTVLNPPEVKQGVYNAAKKILER